jgi:hypothetical protein
LISRLTIATEVVGRQGQGIHPSGLSTPRTQGLVVAAHGLPVTLVASN